MLPAAPEPCPAPEGSFLPFAQLIARRSAARAYLAAPIAAMLLVVVALAGPAAAVTGPTKLLNPAVSPRSGSTATTITFTVTYRNREGSAPATVRVVIGGTAHAMRPASSGSDYKSGVRFRVALHL